MGSPPGPGPPAPSPAPALPTGGSLIDRWSVITCRRGKHYLENTSHPHVHHCHTHNSQDVETLYLGTDGRIRKLHSRIHTCAHTPHPPAGPHTHTPAHPHATHSRIHTTYEALRR